MVLTFISAVGSGNETSVLTAVQLLWVNLIMDTFAALALATDPPTPSILNRKPEPKSAPLITVTMWKMIVGQSIFQLAVTLVLYFAGNKILSYNTPGERGQLQTLIFNTFVWMQIFNQYNSRRLDNKLNLFEGITNNYFFIGIQFIIVAGQVLIVFVGGAAFSVQRLNGPQWGISLVLGLLSMPVAIIIRLIPDSFAQRVVPKFLKRKATPAVLVSDEERQFEWNPALEEIKEELAFLKIIRGGRLNVLRYKLQHPRGFLPRSRSASRSRTSSIPGTPTGERASEHEGGSLAPPTPESRRSMTRRRGRSRSNSAFGPAAAMAGIVAGSIAGWSPIDRREGDTSRFQSIDDRTDLDARDGIEVHPDTKPDDPVLADASAMAAPNTSPPSQTTENNPVTAQNLVSPSNSSHEKPGLSQRSDTPT